MKQQFSVLFTQEVDGSWRATGGGVYLKDATLAAVLRRLPRERAEVDAAQAAHERWLENARRRDREELDAWRAIDTYVHEDEE